MDLEFREYALTDEEAARLLLNEIFSGSYQSVESWACWTGEDFTAPVALIDGKLVGAIPLKRRVYRVAPGAEAVAWVEHRVGVAEEHRATGLGSGMQSCAKEFLAGRGDVLLVHRGAERSPGYRYYEKNGLLDVSHPRAFALAPRPVAETAAAGVRWLDAEDFFARGELWFEIFQDCWGEFGGYVRRSVGSLYEMANNVLWRSAIVYEFSYGVVERDGAPAGYIVVGRRGEAGQIMEMAVRGGSVDLAARLLDAARGRGAAVQARVTPGTVVEAAFRRLEARPPARESGATCIMVCVLDVESTGAKVWGDAPELRNVEVRVWTPLREGVIHRAEAAARTVTIELKEHMLSRLLMRRLDVRAAVQEERMTLHGDEPGDLEALARALKPCRWMYHQFDYL